MWLALTKSLLRITIEVSLGIYLGQLVEVLGWTRRLGALVRPLLALGRIPDPLHAAFTTAFVSAAAANAGLVAHRDRGTLTNRHLMFGALLNSFPGQFSHLPSQLIPLALLVGWRVAGAFFGIQIAAGLLRTFCVLLWARFTHQQQTTTPEVHASASQKVPIEKAPASVFRLALCRSARTLRRVLLVTLPLCALFIFLRTVGAFDQLGPLLQSLPVLANLAPEAPAVVLAHFASLLTAATTASDLLKNGIMNPRMVALVLLTGSLLATPIRTLRHSGGIYLGIFGVRQGVCILLLNQGLRMSFALLGILLLGHLWM